MSEIKQAIFRSRPMNEDKLKELQERLVLVVADQSRFSIECTELSDLIKYVRQLEKDKQNIPSSTWSVVKEYRKLKIANAELLAALKKARKEIMYYSDLRPDDSIIKRIDRALNKHKGE